MSSSTLPLTYRCWVCGRECKADRHMQKWLAKRTGQNDIRPVGPCCAYGGYFGGS